MAVTFFPRTPFPADESVIKDPARWRDFIGQLNRQLDEAAGDVSALNDTVTTITTPTGSGANQAILGPWGWRWPIAVTISAIDTWTSVSQLALHSSDQLPWAPTGVTAIVSVLVPATCTFSLRAQNITDAITCWQWDGITSAQTKYTTTTLLSWPINQDKNLQFHVLCSASGGGFPVTFNFGEWHALAKK